MFKSINYLASTSCGGEGYYLDCDYSNTAARTAFIVALTVISIAITGFALYLISSTMWGKRWTRRER